MDLMKVFKTRVPCKCDYELYKVKFICECEYRYLCGMEQSPKDGIFAFLEVYSFFSVVFSLKFFFIDIKQTWKFIYAFFCFIFGSG